MSFESDIDAAYKKKVVGLQEKVIRKVAIDVQSGLDIATPVDTGRARSNWLASIGIPRTDTVESTGGSTPINFSGYKLGLSIFIANNLPYISRLNQGSSQQAPSGFVDNVIQRVTNQVSNIAKGFRL